MLVLDLFAQLKAFRVIRIKLEAFCAIFRLPWVELVICRGGTGDEDERSEEATLIEILAAISMAIERYNIKEDGKTF